jgi:3,4-dihydroxy-2-butanone 4-phosphate synthase
MVIVTDDEDRENEGDLILAAQFCEAEHVAFMRQHGSGVICVPMQADHLERLALPQMVDRNEAPLRTAFTVSVDAKAGTTTGISAADRALTIRRLADPAASADDFSRPGHVFPLQARAGGVLERPGQTEAALDLCALAGLAPVAAICEITNEDGSMARRPELRRLARRDLTPARARGSRRSCRLVADADALRRVHRAPLPSALRRSRVPRAHVR